MKNIQYIYSRTALYFGIHLGVFFLLTQMILNPYFFVIGRIALVLALTPLEFWWYYSLLEVIKEEYSPMSGFRLFYQKKMLCKKALGFQLLCQGVVLWFWGVGRGFLVEEGNVLMQAFGIFFGLLQCVVPFLAALLLQPFHVNLLLSPDTALGKQLLFSWKLMRGNRMNLLCLWGRMLFWILLLLLPAPFLLYSSHWLVLLIFCMIQWLAVTAAAPYVALAGVLFSLRLLR